MVKLFIRYLMRDHDKQYEYAREVKNYKDVSDYLDSIGEHQEKYQRMWVEGADLVVDYGSWSKYAVIRFNSEKDAMSYIASGREDF